MGQHITKRSQQVFCFQRNHDHRAGNLVAIRQKRGGAGSPRDTTTVGIRPFLFPDPESSDRFLMVRMVPKRSRLSSAVTSERSKT